MKPSPGLANWRGEFRQQIPPGAAQVGAAAEHKGNTFLSSFQAPRQLSGGECPSEAAPSNSA
jgi:hypothetical protein